MKQEIINLADDIELEGNKRNSFILEIESAIELMDENDYDQFYSVADKIMQKYY
jgi:hypothetical protein